MLFLWGFLGDLVFAGRREEARWTVFSNAECREVARWTASQFAVRRAGARRPFLFTSHILCPFTQILHEIYSKLLIEC